MRNKIAKGAPEFMKKMGEETDSKVFEEVRKRPGSTVREIAESLGWTNGKVDGSVNRLISRGKLKVQHCVRRAVLVKKVFLADYSAKPGVFEIPKKMVDESLWKKSVSVYALSRTTIGLSSTKMEDWEKLAVKKQEVPINRDVNSLVIELPQFFVDFYQLENSETTLSTVGDSGLITVESTIPVELPQTFPALRDMSITGIVIGVGAISSVAKRPLTFRWDPTKEEQFERKLPKELVTALFRTIERELELIEETSEANMLQVKVAT